MRQRPANAGATALEATLATEREHVSVRLRECDVERGKVRDVPEGGEDGEFFRATCHLVVVVRHDDRRDEVGMQLQKWVGHEPVTIGRDTIGVIKDR